MKENASVTVDQNRDKPVVFISYAHEDRDFGLRLVRKLTEIGIDTMGDWQIPPTVPYEEALRSYIEAANTFLFIISPDSVKSDACRKEIDYAFGLNKRLAPVVHRDVPDDAVHAALRSLNWIFIRRPEDIDNGSELLKNGIEVDQDWEKVHNRLLRRAIDWNRRDRNTSYTLRKSDLQEAERWLAQAGTDQNKMPRPTQLQTEYIFASRGDEKKRQRQALGAVTVGFLIAIALAVLAFSQYRIAVASTKEAQTQRDNAEQQKARAETNEGIAIGARRDAENALAGERVAKKQAEDRRKEAEKQKRIADERRLEAEKQSKIALSRQLAVQAVSFVDDSQDLSLLLSQEANNVYQTAEARNSLLAALNYSPRLKFQLYSDAACGEVAYSPDGKTIASGNDDGTVTLWDAATRDRIGEPLKGHGNGYIITSVAFSPDGKLLASSCRKADALVEDGSELIRLYDVTTRRPVDLKFLGDDSTTGVQNVVFTPDGKTLLSGYSGYTWDVKTGKRIETRIKSLGGKPYIAISPDGKIIAIAAQGGILDLWDVASQERIDPRLSETDCWSKPKESDPAPSMAFSPDSKTLAVGLADGTIRLWDVATHKSLDPPLIGSRSRVWSIAFSPDGRILASSGEDGTIQLWNIATHNLLTPDFGTQWRNTLEYNSETGKDSSAYRFDPPGPFGWPLLRGSRQQGGTRISFSPDGKSLVSGSQDSILRVWDVSISDLTERDAEDNQNKIAVSPDGKLLAWCEGETAVRLWDVATNKAIDPLLVGHKDAIDKLSFSPDAKLLISCSRDDVANLWKVTNRELLYSVDLPSKSGIEEIAISPDGKTIAYDQYDKIQLYDIKRKKRLGSPLSGHKGGIHNLIFSPDGRILASGGDDETIRLWDIVKRQQIKQLPTGHIWGSVTALAFGQRGKILASGDERGTIILWDMASQRPIGSLQGHVDEVWCLTFSPDGKTLASSGLASEKPINILRPVHERSIPAVQLWDVETRQPLGTALRSLLPYRTVGFSQDGKTLFGMNQTDQVHRLLEFDTAHLRERACSMANRNLTDEEWLRFFGKKVSTTCLNLPIPKNAK